MSNKARLAATRVSSEFNLVQADSALPLYSYLLSAAPAIATSGAAGLNVTGFVDVAEQRVAVWNLFDGLNTGSITEVNSAISAMQYGFAHQNSDGSFQIVAKFATQGTSAAAFFLGTFARIYLAVQNSWAWSSEGATLQAMLPALRSGMTSLLTQVPNLKAQDGATTNRLFFDATAFLLSGQILGDPTFTATGKIFLEQALSQQLPDGAFLEDGGGDTGYQAVSMVNLEALIADSQSASATAMLKTALSNALGWELSNILTDGQVSTVDNTRTGNGQEIGPSGQPKVVSYSEVALALYDAATLLGSKAAAAAAKSVTSYGVAHAGGFASSIPTGGHKVIDAGPNGQAVGTSGNDTLVATASGQTLIGNGGNDIFDIGAFANTKIVTGSTGITAVETTATKYTLAAGVNDLVVTGNAPHMITGNGLDNLIVGSDANDTISGGGGNVVIDVGLGGNLLTGGGQYDVFAFMAAADHDNIITDFKVGYDVLDLRQLFATAGFEAGLQATYLQVAQSGADTVVSIANAGTTATGPTGGFHTLVTLDNVHADALLPAVGYIV